LALLSQRLADSGAQIIETLHDEIILASPDRLAEEAVAILKETMIQAGEDYLGRIPVELEVTIGESWVE
jgi:DNA polymerase I-like protein with 3'-5' exonuclease and polymerase domains